MFTFTFTTILIALTFAATTQSTKYKPNWESIDSRPLPNWYDEAKVGIFIHWGVFSVPSFGSEWFWYRWKGPKPWKSNINFVKNNYRPDWTYADFAKDLTVQEGIYNPDHWAEIFNASGARYVVQVTKHHEGYTSWPSNYSFNWNAMAVGPKRDLVGEIAQAVRKYPNLRYGIYHSLFEWFNPMYLDDKNNNFTTQNFVKYKTMPELYELVNTYKPEIIWSDGCHGPSSYWNSTYFLAWLYNDSPVKDTVVTNDRWGTECKCRHGGYFTCRDRYNPGVLMKRKFENAMTLDKYSWGYRRNTKLFDVLEIEKLIATMVKTVSCNGNILINVGPTKDGIVAPIYEERLRQLGSWLGVNGEAIYGSHPWTYQNDTFNPNVWYTAKGHDFHSRVLYAITLHWPDEKLVLGAPTATSTTRVTLLGYKGSNPENGTPSFDYEASNQGMIIHMPRISYNQMPCMWAWVFKITHVKKN